MRWPRGKAMPLPFVIAGILASILAGCGESGSRTGARSAVTCSGADSIDFDCYQRRYHQLFIAEGPRAAVDDLAARRDDSGYLRAACHQVMHGIGRDAGRSAGISAFDDGNATCSSGYYHGVVEAVMERIGRAAIGARAADVCAPFRTRDPRSLDTYNCIHGMGHGFMGLYRSDVFRSLDGCGELTDRWEQEQCYGGVFMENLTAIGNAHRPSRYVRPDEPLYPCTAVDARYKPACYLKQTAYAVAVRSDDFRGVFELCARSPDIRYRDVCFQGVGGDVSIHASKYVNGDAAQRAMIRRLCALSPSRSAGRECIAGAVGEIVRDGATGHTDVPALCRELARGELRTTCRRTRRETLREFPPIKEQSFLELCAIAVQEVLR